MAIIAAELIAYGAVNRPEDDTSTVGGAIDAAARPLDAELASASNVEALSDGADTRTLTVHYRLPSGVRGNANIVLNGTTPVALGVTIERIERAVLNSSSGTRTVTLRVVSGGATQHTFNPNETAAFRMFIDAVSAASAKVYYEKIFLRNTNGSLSLLAAKVDATADPSGKGEIGIASAVNDSATATNRLTAPGSVTFVSENVDQNVPGTDLAAGSQIGVWIKLSLASNEPPIKSSYTARLRGNSV